MRPHFAKYTSFVSIPRLNTIWREMGTGLMYLMIYKLFLYNIQEYYSNLNDS